MKAIVTKGTNQESIIVVSKNNPEKASIMLKSLTLGANDQGFFTKETRVGFFKGDLKDLMDLNLKEGDDFSAKVFPVKLVVEESLDAFYAGQEPKINPETKEVITSTGAPVYRQTIVVNESSAKVDSKIISDKATTAAPVAAQVKVEFGK